MMAASMTTLSSVVAAKQAPAAQGDAGDSQQGADSFGSLLGAAAAPPAESPAPKAATQPAEQDATKKETDDDAKSDADAPSEVAAMIAALLAAAGAAPAAAASTKTTTSADGVGAVGDATKGAAADAGTATQGGAANAQLQDLLADASDPAAVATTPATASTTADAATDKSAPNAGFQQLLQSRANPATAPRPDANADVKIDPAPLAAVLSQLADESGGHAHDVAAVVAAAGASQLDADTLQAQAQTPQPQAAALAPTPLPQATTTDSSQTLQAPVGSARWADELGSRMVLMNLRGQHDGSLTLTPEHLGPLEVRLSVNQGTADVWFGSQHADTRAALTEALPRLRELFANAGMTLGHAGVSQEAPRQNTREGAAPRVGAAGQDVLDAGINTSMPQSATRRVVLGLVDTYA